MRIREGLIPTALGTIVTATGLAMRQSHRVSPNFSNTLFGFGLAHVVLGAIDLMEHRHTKLFSR
ncbi:hypothetical protein [Anoxybacteroides tepidamans]|uniref:hypothetical protein n=1 Tax=Anoxybacteroides tepidamans TaxID=265948 RepID=UPI0004811E67|nr:hypothetical protein [Anoxybacillus tepidamans]